MCRFLTSVLNTLPKGVARGVLRNRIAIVYAPRARLTHKGIIIDD